MTIQRNARNAVFLPFFKPPVDGVLTRLQRVQCMQPTAKNQSKNPTNRQANGCAAMGVAVLARPAPAHDGYSVTTENGTASGGATIPGRPLLGAAIP